MNNYLATSYDLNNADLVSVIDELPLWSAPFGLRLLEKINYRKNIVAIDIGSGTGFPLLEVAMRLGQTSKLYGIDPWGTAVERTRSKIKIYGINNVELITGFAEEIPVADNSVDLIFSNNGLNNVSDINKVLNECRRISKTGTQLVFTYNTDKTMYEFYSIFEELLLEKKLQKEVEALRKHIHKKRKPVKEFVQLLHDNRFSVKEVSSHDFSYQFVTGTAMLNHFLIKLAFIESWKEIILKEKQIPFFAALEEKLNYFASKNEILKLTIPFVLIDCERV